jgi:hypothetical protein
MRSAALTTLTALFLCVGPAAHAGPANLVSSVGRVEVDGAPARAGIMLRPAATLQTRAGGVVQVLIGWRLALAAGGRCTLQLKPEGLVVRSDHCLLRLSGASGSLELAGWRLKLGQGGGTLMLDGERLFITAGRVHLRAAGGKAYQLRAGQATDLAVGGPAVALGRAAPTHRVLQLSRTFQPPPPWAPPGQAVDLSVIQRARGQMQQAQQREREAASCGCTEGGSTGGGIGTAGPDGGPSIEARTAGLRLRINGLPRKTK